MTKADIISKTLKEINLTPAAQESYDDEADYEEDVIKTLETRLPDGDIKTCEDFKHLNVKCCETCHEFYPQYDMSVFELRWKSLGVRCRQVGVPRLIAP